MRKRTRVNDVSFETAAKAIKSRDWWFGCAMKFTVVRVRSEKCDNERLNSSRGLMWWSRRCQNFVSNWARAWKFQDIFPRLVHPEKHGPQVSFLMIMIKIIIGTIRHWFIRYIATDKTYDILESRQYCQ